MCQYTKDFHQKDTSTNRIIKFWWLAGVLITGNSDDCSTEQRQSTLWEIEYPLRANQTSDQALPVAACNPCFLAISHDTSIKNDSKSQ